MNEFFLGMIEITAGMSLLILVMLFGLKLIGGKFTAKCRYILWTLVMIRLAVPLSFGILPALIEVPVESEPEPVQIQTPVADYAPMPQNPVSIPPQEPVQMPDTPVQTPVFTEPEPEPITWEDVKAYIPHAYLAGAAVFLLWNLLSYRIYTAKILRTAREADGGTQEIYEAVCRKKGLSHPPVLLVSPDVNSPAAFGLIRRRIVLPEIDFTENGLAGTLSHEVTHCKRGDLWIKALCLLARALHWFNPLVHLAAFRCEMEMELSCDESVLAGCDENTRAAYGEVMLDIIKRCRRNRGVLTTHFNPKKNAVKARFTNILYGSGKKRGLWLIAVCLVLCLIAGAIVACQTEEADIQDETADERDSVLWTYALSDTEILSYGTDDNDVYYLYASGGDGGSYPLTEISLDLFQYGSNETLHETLPLHAVSTDTGYLFYLRYHIQHAYFYEFSLIRKENRLVFDDIRMLTEEEAKELGIYSAEMVTITSLEELARYLADGIITQGLYDFYYDLLSGKSDIPEYNTLQIEDYTIRFTVPMTGYASYFSFTVTESGLDTLPPGTYDWQILDIREVTVSGRSANHSAYTDIPEVQKLFTFFDGYFAYNTPFFGEAMPHPAIHNYIIEHYGTNGSMDRDEYMQIAEAEFGITDFSSMRLEDWTDENGRLFSGGVGGGWYGEVTEVWEHEESENVHITIQFYADCNYLLKSHKIAYKFGYDRTWQGYSFVSRSVYEPGDMYFAEYGSVYEGITAGEGMQIPLAFPFADMTLTVPAVWENIAIVKTSETGFDIYEKTANEYWNSRDKSNTGGGCVCTVAYYTKEEFAEVEAQFRESEGVDVYAEGFGHSVVLGTDANYVYTMVEATDVPWDGVPNPSEAQYKQIQYQMQTVLTTFMDENGITPNPLCPASIVYTPEIKDTIFRETSGNYPTMEAYVTDRMAKETTAQYFAAEPDGSFSNKQKTANVTDTKLLRLEKKGELADLAPEGTLECWEYKYLIKLDVPTEEVMIVGGQQEEDGWFDLEGQGNHTTVALRYPDGSYTVLRDAVVADGIDFTGYRNSYEEAIYDWYVTEYGLDLPLYVQDWINEITLPDTAIMGNQPVHRFDGEGWGIYIPISTWYQSTDAMENQWLWRSSYNTGSTLMVDVFSHSLEDEYVTAEKQGYTPADSTKRVWENHTDGLHSCYYYYENPNGGFWRVTNEWTDEGVTNDNANIVIEPQLLQLMAESFVVFGETYSGIPTSPTVENFADADSETIWLNFLNHVVSPYSDYVVTHEFLDLDGNGIDELIIYNWGASASCGIEIFTIENREVRSFSTGTNGITHYSGKGKSLAPPAANAVDFGFWGLPTSYADKSDVVLWFTPCTNRKGHVLYSMNGSDVHTSEDYYYFTSDANGNLTVEVLRAFRCEAIDSNPVNGWKCYISGEKVNVRAFRDNMSFFWQDLSVSHGVQYHDKNTASRYDELEAWMEESVEDIVLPEEQTPDGLVDINAEPYTYTREEWIKYSLYSDFGFREPVDVSALTDDELTAYMADAYQCALDIWFLFEVCSDRMYARNVWSSDMPHVEIDGRHYSQMFNPVFPTLADLESYMNGVLSHDLTGKLLSMGMFIDYEGELWGMMGARGTDISKKTVGFSVTSRTDTEIIYTAEVEVREHDLSAEEPDYVEYHDFTYALTEDGWRWTDFYLYN